MKLTETQKKQQINELIATQTIREIVELDSSNNFTGETIIEEYNKTLELLNEASRVEHQLELLDVLSKDLQAFNKTLVKYPELKELKLGVKRALSYYNNILDEVQRRSKTLVGKIANKIPMMKGTATGARVASLMSVLGGGIGYALESKSLVAEETVRLVGYQTLPQEVFDELVRDGIMNNHGVVNLRRYAQVMRSLGQGPTFTNNAPLTPYLDQALLGPYEGRHFEVVPSVRRVVRAISQKHPELMNKVLKNLFGNKKALYTGSKAAKAITTAATAKGGLLSMILNPVTLGALVAAGVGAGAVYGLVNYISGKLQDIKSITQFYMFAHNLFNSIPNHEQEIASAKESNEPKEIALLKRQILLEALSGVNETDVLKFVLPSRVVDELFNMNPQQLDSVSKDAKPATDEATAAQQAAAPTVAPTPEEIKQSAETLKTEPQSTSPTISNPTQQEAPKSVGKENPVDGSNIDNIFVPPTAPESPEEKQKREWKAQLRSQINKVVNLAVQNDIIPENQNVMLAKSLEEASAVYTPNISTETFVGTIQKLISELSKQGMVTGLVRSLLQIMAKNIPQFKQNYFIHNVNYKTNSALTDLGFNAERAKGILQIMHRSPTIQHFLKELARWNVTLTPAEQESLKNIYNQFKAKKEFIANDDT